MNIAKHIDDSELGERLRIARNSSGLTQEDVATVLDVARTTLVAIERGKRRVRSEELIKLADLYNVTVNDLVRPTAIHVDLAARFRRLPTKSDSSAHEREAVALLTKLATSSLELETLLGYPTDRFYPPARPISSGDITIQAEDIALALRHRLGLGLAPIADIVSLMELELGVRVFVYPIKGAISGVYAFDKKVGACILLNAAQPNVRRIFSAGHELGHFMSVRDLVDVYNDEATYQDRDEVFANAFAASFLMPATAVRERFREFVDSEGKFSTRHLIILANVFHVSMEALCRRLEALSLVPRKTYEALRAKGLSASLAREAMREEPRKVVQDTSPRLTFLAIEALERGLMSEGQICDILGIDRLDIRELLNIYGAGVDDGAELA